MNRRLVALRLPFLAIMNLSTTFQPTWTLRAVSSEAVGPDKRERRSSSKMSSKMSSKDEYSTIASDIPNAGSVRLPVRSRNIVVQDCTAFWLCTPYFLLIKCLRLEASVPRTATAPLEAITMSNLHRMKKADLIKHVQVVKSQLKKEQQNNKDYQRFVADMCNLVDKSKLGAINTAKHVHNKKKGQVGDNASQTSATVLGRLQKLQMVPPVVPLGPSPKKPVSVAVGASVRVLRKSSSFH